MPLHIGSYFGGIILISVKLVKWYNLASKANISCNFDPKKYFLFVFGVSRGQKCPKTAFNAKFWKVEAHSLIQTLFSGLEFNFIGKFDKIIFSTHRIFKNRVTLSCKMPTKSTKCHQRAPRKKEEIA